MCRVGVGVIHWNVGELPVATPSRENESLSPKELSTANGAFRRVGIGEHMTLSMREY